MPTNRRIRVMVVDDHPIMRKGLRDVLQASACLEVVGEAQDGEEAVRTVEGLAPDVVLMDAIMPRKDGITACREIMELLPDVRVLILTASTEENVVIDAVAAGATGYLEKYSRPEELEQVILGVAEGRLQIPDKDVGRVFAMVQAERQKASRRASDELTELELETVRQFASGMSNTAMAEAAGKSTVTIRNTLYRIQQKLGIGSKQELVIWAVRKGLVDDVIVGH